MSADQLKLLLEAVQADSSLHEKLNAATSAEEAVAMAKDAGFAISVEEVKLGKDVSCDQLADLYGGNANQIASLEAGMKFFWRWSNPI